MGLILLDLDGTLVADALVEVGGKLQRRQHELYTEPELLPNRLNVLAEAAEEGDSFAIVTNQGGVAWGYHTQAECYQRIASTVRQLGFFEGRPFSLHVCFAHERATVDGFKADAARRKPAPTMIQEALHVHGVDAMTPEAIMVGNRAEDREAAAAAGVDFALAHDFFASLG